jgi:hypothetical protein
MVEHTYSTQEAKAGTSQDQGQPALYIETLSQKKKKIHHIIFRPYWIIPTSLFILFYYFKLNLDTILYAKHNLCVSSRTLYTFRIL